MSLCSNNKIATDLEKQSILCQELGQIGVSESPDEHHIFRFVRILTFERSSHDQHRLDGSHTKVIMVLLGQLLRAQLVHLGHFLGQILGVFKTLRVEDHLSNQSCLNKEIEYVFEIIKIIFYGKNRSMHYLQNDEPINIDCTHSA